MNDNQDINILDQETAEHIKFLKQLRHDDKERVKGVMMYMIYQNGNNMHQEAVKSQ